MKIKKRVTLFLIVLLFIFPSALAEETKLVVAGSMNLPVIYASYEQDHPGTVIEISDRWETEMLLEDALSHSDNVDVYIFHPLMDTSYTMLRDRGFLLTLETPELLAFSEKVYPEVIQACMHEGKLCAVPVGQIVQGIISVFPDAWAAVGMSEADLPTTWSEFLHFIRDDWPALAAKYEDFSLCDGRSEFDLLNQIARDYEARRARDGYTYGYDTPEFREVLSLFEGIDEKMISEKKFNALFSMNYRPMVVDDFTNRKFLPLVFAEGEKSVIPTAVFPMAVNPNSSQLDKALDFVAYTVNHLDPQDLRELCPDENTPVEADYMPEEEAEYEQRLAQYESQIEAAENEGARNDLIEERDAYIAEKEAFFRDYRYAISPDSIARYRETVEGLLTPVYNKALSSEEYAAVNQKREQFLAGAINADQYINELERRFVMNILENS